MSREGQHEQTESGLDIHGFPSARNVVVGMGLAFVFTLAIVVGKRMSADAVAIVVGVIVAILASVPALILVALVLRFANRRISTVDDLQQQQARPYPPVVVIQGGMPQQSLPPGYWPAPAIHPQIEEEASYRILGQD